MIISASRRTDIPAFYSDWFYNRINAGHVDIVNPFNPLQIRRIELNPESIDCIVFWTRNAAGLFKYLDDLDCMGYRYIFLYTITGYPKELEENLPRLDNAVETFKRLSDRIGPARVIWRYDPIVLSSITDENYHDANFRAIAKALSGYTGRVIISFVDPYKKVRSRLKRLEIEKEIRFSNTSLDDCNRIVSEFKHISDDHQMRIQSCAEETDLSKAGVLPGSCIDSNYINEIFNLEIPYKKDPGQRKRCLCSQSVDIGSYNTCGYRCLYCYANDNFAKSGENLKIIDKYESSLYIKTK
jgi:hypothetical protein